MIQDRLAHLWPGVPLALGSAVLFGASTPLSKLLLASLSPQLLAGVLYLGAGVGLAGVHLGRAALGILGLIAAGCSSRYDRDAIVRNRSSWRTV